MRVTKAELRNVRSSGADIKISNGIREFMITIDKKDLSFNDIINYCDDTKITVHSMIRNCCAACPVTVLEKGKNEADDNELKEVLYKVVEIIGEDLKERLK